MVDLKNNCCKWLGCGKQVSEEDMIKWVWCDSV